MGPARRPHEHHVIVSARMKRLVVLPVVPSRSSRTFSLPYRLHGHYRVLSSLAGWAALGHGLWSALGTPPLIPAPWAVVGLLLLIGGSATTAAQGEWGLRSGAPAATVLGGAVVAVSPIPLWASGVLAARAVLVVACRRRGAHDSQAPAQALLFSVVSVAAVLVHPALLGWSALSPRRDT